MRTGFSVVQEIMRKNTGGKKEQFYMVKEWIK